MGNVQKGFGMNSKKIVPVQEAHSRTRARARARAYHLGDGRCCARFWPMREGLVLRRCAREAAISAWQAHALRPPASELRWPSPGASEKASAVVDLARLGASIDLVLLPRRGAAAPSRRVDRPPVARVLVRPRSLPAPAAVEEACSRIRLSAPCRRGTPSSPEASSPQRPKRAPPTRPRPGDVCAPPARRPHAARATPARRPRDARAARVTPARCPLTLQAILFAAGRPGLCHGDATWRLARHFTFHPIDC